MNNNISLVKKTRSFSLWLSFPGWLDISQSLQWLTQDDESDFHLHLLLHVVVVGDLALVLAGVLPPWVLDLEGPDVVSLLVERGEAGVGGVADAADREDAQVAGSDPGDLEKRGQTNRKWKSVSS